MEKFMEYLQEAEKIVKTVGHMMYITFPLIKDKRILLKIILETKIAITNCINSILQYEYLFKKIKLYENQKLNFNTFNEKCAPKYSITNTEMNQIKELFHIVEYHKGSSMEFLKDGKLVLLSEGQNPITLSIAQIKEFSLLSQKILNKTKKMLIP